jgi:hypothetical protein
MLDTPRPSRFSDGVTWEVARALASDLEFKAYEDAEEEGYDGSEFQAMVETLRDKHDWDGYALAKYLEDMYHMDMDTDVVNTLDAAYMYQSKAHDAQVKQWVIDNKAVPKYAVDAVVRVARNAPGDELVGVIKTVHATILRYTVYIQEHAEEARAGGYLGTLYDEEQLNGLVL